MESKTLTFKTYTFTELNPKTQDKVINNEIQGLLDCIPYKQLSNNMQKAVDKAESMQTPWFMGSYIMDYAKDEVMESVNDLTYLIDGTPFERVLSLSMKA